VSDRASIIERGQIRWTGSMAALMADTAARQAYLSV
jgi:branched-chain amino acid transport system ATP-binding protein